MTYKMEDRATHAHFHMWNELWLHAKCPLQDAMFEKVVRNLRDEGARWHSPHKQFNDIIRGQINS